MNCRPRSEITVRGKATGYPNMVIVFTCRLVGCDRLNGRDEPDQLGQVVNGNHNRIVPGGVRQDQ